MHSNHLVTEDAFSSTDLSKPAPSRSYHADVCDESPQAYRAMVIRENAPQHVRDLARGIEEDDLAGA
jgi:hypothetical protein